MVRLYNGSGITGGTLEDQYPAKLWVPIKSTAVKMLRQQGRSAAADELEARPFDYYHATNAWGDEFAVLYQAVALEDYAMLTERSLDRAWKATYTEIAKAVTEIAPMYIRSIWIEILHDTSSAIPISMPNLRITSDSVERALKNAEELIAKGEGGAANALDRVHTAFHAYLRAVCDDAGISYAPDGGITVLFKAVRREHPAFAGITPYDASIKNVVMPFGATVDALNTLRNNASLAHPNSRLLAEPEAVLLIMATQTLLHYLDKKLR